MLNEANKNAIVTEMSPPELATPEAERSQVQRVCPDEVAGGQLRQLQVAEPAHKHVDSPCRAR